MRKRKHRRRATLDFEVIGFRQWLIGPDLDLMSAGNHGVAWRRGENVATCVGGKCKEPPSKKCECGLYALHSPDNFWYGPGSPRANPFAQRVLAYNADSQHIAGVISAWGRIEVHAEGFRAENARVVALATSSCRRDQVLARAVAAEYGVPLIDGKNLAQVALEFGAVVPEDMRPKKKADPHAEYRMQRQQMYLQLLQRKQDYLWHQRQQQQSAIPQWMYSTGTTSAHPIYKQKDPQ